MTRASLLAATAWFCLAAGTAGAQVSVPLPQAQPKAPPPAPAPQSSPTPGQTTVPLPGKSTQPAQPAEPDINSLPIVGQPGTSSLPIGKYGRPDINPYDRDLDLTVPLMFRNRSLGDLPIRLTYDDRLLVDRRSFEKLIAPLLTKAAMQRVTAIDPNAERLESDALKAMGISFEYDPSSLAVVVLTIDPSQRAVENLFAPPSAGQEVVDLSPASVSAFLNINAYYGYVWNGAQSQPPEVALNGAIRIRKFVFEGDGQFGQDNFGGGAYTFNRNYARLVYDLPSDYIRLYLGDLTPEVRGQQGYAQIGGIGISRQRQRFDPYRSSVLQGNRQLLLQNDATVRILRNGVLYREMRLDAGSYDLSSLPLLAGSNDVQIQVSNNAGGFQTIDYSQYLDPIDLAPGDFEYAAYIGPTSTNFGRTPKYNGPVSFSGFYRKAFLNAPAIGVGVQANRDTQTLTAQTQFVLPGGSRLLFDGGVSNARRVGQGYSLGIGYDLLIDRGGLVDSASVRVDYVSRRFAVLSMPVPDNVNSFNLSAQYTHQFSQRFSLLAVGSYLGNRDRRDSYRLGVSGNYYITSKLSIRAGVDYTKLDSSFGRGRGLGASISIVFQPSYRDRAEARYESSTDSQALSYIHNSSNQIGSLGYGAVANRDNGAINAQGFADYTANRFDATLSQASYGPSFRQFGAVNLTSVRVGTSIAFADGVVGVGRRINDSFALLYPHHNLGGRSVVAGQSLAQSDYMSKSGTFGAAVNGYLTSYVNQPIQYDVQDVPPGYDIGPGSVRVNPPYHSGYRLRVGTDAFASAMGTLLLPNGQPVALIGGRVIAEDGKDKEPLPFFTNSVGRFAIQNLRPAVTYRVELGSGAVTFQFSVPGDTTGLVDLKTITLKPVK